MPRMIFVNLPVSDIARSTAFYQALGFERNAKLSNGQAASMMWSAAIVVGLLGRDVYNSLTPKQIVDAHTQTQALFALGLDSRAEVDALTEAAIAAGGREAHPPEDHGFMYSRAFEDPDGHGFGPFWMDPTAAENRSPENA